MRLIVQLGQILLRLALRGEVEHFARGAPRVVVVVVGLIILAGIVILAATAGLLLLTAAAVHVAELERAGVIEGVEGGQLSRLGGRLDVLPDLAVQTLATGLQGIGTTVHRLLRTFSRLFIAPRAFLRVARTLPALVPGVGTVLLGGGAQPALIIVARLLAVCLVLARGLVLGGGDTRVPALRVASPRRGVQPHLVLVRAVGEVLDLEQLLRGLADHAVAAAATRAGAAVLVVAAAARVTRVTATVSRLLTALLARQGPAQRAARYVKI